MARLRNELPVVDVRRYLLARYRRAAREYGAAVHPFVEPFTAKADRLELGLALTVYAWELPAAVRLPAGLGINDRVELGVDDVLRVENQVGRRRPRGGGQEIRRATE